MPIYHAGTRMIWREEEREQRRARRAALLAEKAGRDRAADVAVMLARAKALRIEAARGPAFVRPGPEERAAARIEYRAFLLSATFRNAWC